MGLKKIIIVVTVLASAAICFARNDSVEVMVNYLENTDLRLINSLNGIEYFKVSCADTTMKGKVFKLFFDEYFKGELVKRDSLGECSDELIPVIVGKDTAYYNPDICDKLIFKSYLDSMTIRFVGKTKNDTLKLIIAYPGVRFTKRFAGGEKFMFRKLAFSNVKPGDAAPILAYASPFELGSGMNYYCILDTESPGNWFEKFNIKRFYIISLKIE